LRYKNSYLLWQKFLNDNTNMRDTVTAQQNISFDAGAVYEYSTTSDTVKTDATGNIVSPGGSYAANYGFSALGLGFIGDLVISYSASIGKSKTTETQQGI